MFTITQSNDTQILLDHLIHYYQQTQAQRQGEALGISVLHHLSSLFHRWYLVIG